MKLETILVPVDFSDDSDAALEQALDLAAHFESHLHLLHAYDSFSATASAYGGGLPLDFNERIREAAEARLGEWQKRCDERKVACDAHLSAADPTQAIIGLAQQTKADMIVMGTRGLSGVMHLLAGSVAERTVRMAPCPVLTVKHRA